MAWELGDWWESKSSKILTSDAVTSIRCGKARRAIRKKYVLRKVFKLRTIGSDTRVSNPGSVNNKCWNVPDDDPPDDPASITDWMLAGAEYSYDTDSGEVRVTATAIQTDEDWDSVTKVNAFGGL